MYRTRPLFAGFALLFASSPAWSQQVAPVAPPPAPAAEPAPMPAPVPPAPVTLAETPAPVAMAAELPPPPPPPPPAPNKLISAVIYGFTELDMIHDSTQSYNDNAGNALIARPGTQGAKHGRMTFGVRNSRFGFKMKGPESESIKTSGNFEVDLTGNQPSNPPATTESAFFTNPTLRVRHAYLKLETPVVDVLAGQYWNLFGWQSYFHPNTVQIQGVPGEVFGRTPQLRIGHTFKSSAVNVELAVAAVRPTQRDADLPDGQGGLRILINDWKGYRIAGSTGTSVDALGIGVSGTYRHFRVNNFAAKPDSVKERDGFGLSLDALIPVIPATKENHDNALTLTGSFVNGRGINDQYSGLTGGVSNAALPPDANGAAQTYTANIDPGLAVYDGGGNLHTIKWQSYIIGAQYFLPFGGLSISGNVSHMHSKNIANFGAAPASVFRNSTWYDGNLFWDVNGAARFGFEVARSQQEYADGVKANNTRVQLSSFYVF